ncbi:MAG: ABC transporter permease [Halobacteriota archaeon]
MTLLAALATLALVVMFYYPVATVLVEAVVVDGRLTLGPVLAILTSQFYLVDILGFTAYQAVLSTLASLALGLPGAWLLARFEFPGRKTARSLTILPFVLPSIMVAIGFVATFGANGTLNRVLVAAGLEPVSLLYTLEAIIVAHAFYNAPLVARVVTAAWESVDARTVETARSLGASPLRAFRDVVLPQLLPAVVVAAALTFVFTFASFPIVLALGGFRLATVEVFIYSKVNELAYTEAAALAVIETVISVAVTVAYLRYEALHASATKGASQPPRRPLAPPDWSLRDALPRIGLLAYVGVVAVVFVGPLASMLLASVTGPEGEFTLRHYAFLLARQTTGASFQVKPLPAIRNSLVFGVGTLFVALPMGVVLALASRHRVRGSTLVGVLAMAPLTVSGIVVGLGLLRGLVFGIPVAGVRLRVLGPVAIVAAHAVAAYPFVTRNVAPLLDRLDPRLVDAARSLGATRGRVLWDVELPLVAAGVLAGAAFAFAISVGEFDSTVILASGGDSYTMPVAVERYLGRRLGPATAMGSLLLVVTSVSFVVIDRFGDTWGRL